jgi:hypothetical protein
MKRKSVRLSTRCPRACSGNMYAAVPRIVPAILEWIVSVGELAGSGGGVSVVRALARPKSKTFSRPSGVILIFSGFRSR